MLTIRKAQTLDQSALLSILNELDLSCPSQSLDDFWLAQQAEGKVFGVARLQDYGQYLFLSCVGVIEKYRRQGIASQLLKALLKNAKKNVYLYTTIPDFFVKFGFTPTTHTSDLPSRGNFMCEECHPEKCRCMVKLPDVS